MFITCQECNTTFRLDEQLLKPTGSKVRCSQCQLVFVVHPPSAAPAVLQPPVQTPPVEAAPPAADEAFEDQDQDLEGLDLAEFDALLEQGTDFEAEPLTDMSSITIKDSEEQIALDELDAVDLDFDFESALESEEDTQVEEDMKVDDLIAEEAVSEEIDLDMEFDILEGENEARIDERDVETDPGMETSASIDDLFEEEGVEAVEAAGPDNGPASDEMDLDLDLDLDMDLDLEIDAPMEKVVKAPEALSPIKDDLELADLDFDLEQDSDRTVEAAEEQELSLDDGMDSALDDPRSETVTAEDSGSAETDLDLDFDLDLDLEDSGPARADASPVKQTEPELELSEDGQEDIDDLDLSDLDALMTTTGDEIIPNLDAGEMDLDLDLEMEDTPKASSSDALEEELEDLDFSLDDEFEDRTETSQAGDTLAEEDEIDLSEIEMMLGDSPAGKKPDKPVVHRQEDLGLGDDDEIDLSEIESAIDDADLIPERKIDSNALDDQELDLDLKLDLDFDQPEKETESAQGGTAASSDSLDFDLELEMESDSGSDRGESDADDEELDLSDLSALVEDTDRQSKTEVIHSGDIDLEFHLEGDGDEDVEDHPPKKRSAAMVPERFTSSTMDPLLAEEKITAPPKPFRIKKKTNKSLVALFVLVLLAGGGFGLYYAVMERGVAIPYVGDYVRQISDYFNPGPMDLNGTLNLSTLDISSRFVENSQDGRLFVITGKVRNGYDTSREMIRVQGKLYATGKVLAETENSFAGFQIPEQDLVNLSFGEISRRLNTPNQEPVFSTSVRPGQNLPFMLVFADLPPADELDEFAIELISSAPGQ